MDAPVTDTRRAEAAGLYPIFKEEVYRRNARIGTITILGSAGLTSALLAIAVVAEALTVVERIVCAGGIGLFAASLLWQIEREAGRHAQAKIGLIRIERAMGVFEPGRYLPNESLYPGEWITPPPPRRATFVPRLLLSMLTVLTLLQLIVT